MFQIYSINVMQRTRSGYIHVNVNNQNNSSNRQNYLPIKQCMIDYSFRSTILIMIASSIIQHAHVCRAC